MSEIYVETVCPSCGGIGERSDLSVEVGYSVECGSCHGWGLAERREVTVDQLVKGIMKVSDVPEAFTEMSAWLGDAIIAALEERGSDDA